MRRDQPERGRCALDHDFSDWTSNGDGTHTRTCKRYNCTASETDSCSGGTATCVEKAVCKACKAVYGELGAHVFSDEWTIDRYQHWHVCAVCRAKETERLNHFDQDDDHLCDTCGYQITDHTFGTDWSMDETSHWHACSMCAAQNQTRRSTRTRIRTTSATTARRRCRTM